MGKVNYSPSQLKFIAAKKDELHAKLMLSAWPYIDMQKPDGKVERFHVPNSTLNWLAKLKDEKKKKPRA